MVDAVNARLQSLVEGLGCIFVSHVSNFFDEDASIKSDSLDKDGLHLSSSGVNQLLQNLSLLKRDSIRVALGNITHDRRNGQHNNQNNAINTMPDQHRGHRHAHSKHYHPRIINRNNIYIVYRAPKSQRQPRDKQIQHQTRSQRHVAYNEGQYHHNKTRPVREETGRWSRGESEHRHIHSNRNTGSHYSTNEQGSRDNRVSSRWNTRVSNHRQPYHRTIPHDLHCYIGVVMTLNSAVTRHLSRATGATG